MYIFESVNLDTGDVHGVVVPRFFYARDLQFFRAKYIFEILKLNGFEWAYYNPALVAATREAFKDDYDENSPEGDSYKIFLDDVFDDLEELTPRIDENGNADLIN